MSISKSWARGGEGENLAFWVVSTGHAKSATLKRTNPCPTISILPDRLEHFHRTRISQRPEITTRRIRRQLEVIPPEHVDVRELLAHKCKTTVILSGFLKITRPTGVVSSAAPTDFGACEVMRDQDSAAPETTEWASAQAISVPTATRDLDELAKLEVIQRVGTTGRGTYCVLNAPNAPGTPQECPRDRTGRISRLSFDTARP
jgi:hypothetical protein